MPAIIHARFRFVKRVSPNLCTICECWRSLCVIWQERQRDPLILPSFFDLFRGPLCAERLFLNFCALGKRLARNDGSAPQRVDEVLHVDAHGVSGAGLVPLEQKFQDHPVVRQGDILHLLPVL